MNQDNIPINGATGGPSPGPVQDPGQDSSFGGELNIPHNPAQQPAVAAAPSPQPEQPTPVYPVVTPQQVQPAQQPQPMVGQDFAVAANQPDQYGSQPQPQQQPYPAPNFQTQSPQPQPLPGAPVAAGGLMPAQQQMSGQYQAQVPQPAMPPQPMGNVADPSIKEPKIVPKGLQMAMTAVVIIVSAASIFATFRVMGIRAKAHEELPSVKTEKALANDIADVTDPKNGELDLSKVSDASLVAREQLVEAGINKQVNLSDGVSFMVKDFEMNWKGELARWDKPESGNVHLKVDIVAGNRDDNQQRFIDCFLFRIEDKDKKVIKHEYLSDTAFKNDEKSKFESEGTGDSNFLPGEQSSASCVYEVKQSAGPFALVYKGDAFQTEYKDGKATGAKAVSVQGRIKLEK